MRAVHPGGKNSAEHGLKETVRSIDRRASYLSGRSLHSLILAVDRGSRVRPRRPSNPKQPHASQLTPPTYVSSFRLVSSRLEHFMTLN